MIKFKYKLYKFIGQSHDEKKHDIWGFMKIKCHQIDGATVIDLAGTHLDVKVSAEVKQEVKSLIESQQIQKMIINMQHITFVDSSGLGCILSIFKLLHSRGGDLKLACMTKPVRTIFELVCMHKIFEIFNSVEEASHAFRNCKGLAHEGSKTG